MKDDTRRGLIDRWGCISRFFPKERTYREAIFERMLPDKDLKNEYTQILNWSFILYICADVENEVEIHDTSILHKV